MQVHIVKEGESLSVPCVAGGNPPPLIGWRRGNTLLIINLVCRDILMCGTEPGRSDIQRDGSHH